MANALEHTASVSTVTEVSAKATSLATRYRAFVDSQKRNAKTVFYRGEGEVSAVVNIVDAFTAPTVGNYKQESGYLNDPYEGETMTQLM